MELCTCSGFLGNSCFKIQFGFQYETGFGFCMSSVRKATPANQIYRRKLLNMLTHAARKACCWKWISYKPRTVSHWHKVIFDLLPMEYLTHWSRDEINIFYHIWTQFLDHVAPRISNILWKALPRPRNDGWMFKGAFVVWFSFSLFFFF